MTNSQATFYHQVDETEHGKMLKQVLTSRFHFSKKMMQRLKQNQLVTVNDQLRYFTERVQAGDQITIRMMREETPDYIEPQEVPFHIVYEDDDLVVVDKPAGIVVHPTRRHPDHTLANGLFYHWKQRGESHKMRPVTRLDKDTSGLLVVAKHAYAHGYFAKQMAKKRYHRTYLAVVHHPMADDDGTIDAPIYRLPDQGTRRQVNFELGERAITHYQVVRRWEKATLVKLRLETGKTHQIRVHLAWLGHPIIGDPLYGTGTDPHLLQRQALHATHLELFHPRTETWVSWESPLPSDIQGLLMSLSSES